MNLKKPGERSGKIRNAEVWRKFYECACHHEGIMMGYIYEELDECPCIDLAFVKVGKKYCNQHALSWKERIRWCWHILVTGEPWLDMITMQKQVALELAEDLTRFATGKMHPNENT